MSNLSQEEFDSLIADKVDDLLKLVDSRNDKTGKRYSFFPIKDHEVYKFYKTQEALSWSSNTLNFPEDRPDFLKLPEVQKTFLKKIIAFFAVGDGAVSENIALRFMLETETYEEKCFFIEQNRIETIHAETYGLFLELFFPDEKEKMEILESIDEQKVLPIKLKMDWMRKYTTSKLSKDRRYLAFACAEGIFFSALFQGIFFFRSKGILKTLIFANEEISKDESLHRDFGCFMFKRYRKQGKCSDNEAIEMIKAATEIANKFAEYLLPESIEDLTVDNMKKYNMVVADSLLKACGIPKFYNATNPFSWADPISMEQKSNFYEVKVGAYKKFDLKDILNWRKRLDNKISESVYTNPEDNVP